MKRTLFYALLSVVAILGTTFTANAQTPADAPVDSVAVETVAVLVLDAQMEQLKAEIIASVDSLNRVQIRGLHAAVVSQNPRNSSSDKIIPRDVFPFLIIFFIAIPILLIVFWVLKFAYQGRVKRYELKTLQIERAEFLPAPMQVEKPEMSMTRFIRRLLVTGIVAFFIIAWVALVGGPIGFIPTFKYLSLLGGIGYSVVHLFNLYVKRRDEDK